MEGPILPLLLGISQYLYQMLIQQKTEFVMGLLLFPETYK